MLCLIYHNNVFKICCVFFSSWEFSTEICLSLNCLPWLYFCPRSTKSSVTEERIENILRYLTCEVWKFTLRSLYERHKPLFTLMLAMKIDCHKGTITHEEFLAFIKGIFLINQKFELAVAEWLRPQTLNSW